MKEELELDIVSNLMALRLHYIKVMSEFTGVSAATIATELAIKSAEIKANLLVEKDIRISDYLIEK